MSGAMDPGRLESLRREADGVCHDNVLARVSRAELAELLADRDHWESEAKAWRDQCPVTVDHVRGAGITWRQAVRWATDAGLVPCDPEVDTVDQDGDDYAMMRMHLPDSLNECDAVLESVEGDCARSVAYSCNKLSDVLALPAHDILDEMAEVDP